MGDTTSKHITFSNIFFYQLQLRQGPVDTETAQTTYPLPLPWPSSPSFFAALRPACSALGLEPHIQHAAVLSAPRGQIAPHPRPITCANMSPMYTKHGHLQICNAGSY